MEEMGMSDLQYKSFLKQLVNRLERAIALEDDGERTKEIESLIQDLKGDIES